MCSPTIALTVASVASAGLQYKQGKAQQKAQYAQQVRQNELARKNAVARYASAQLKIRQELTKASQSDLRGTLKARKARATYIAGVGDAGGLALSGSTNALLANYQRTEGNFRNAIRNNMNINISQFERNLEAIQFGQESQSTYLTPPNSKLLFATQALNVANTYYSLQFQKQNAGLMDNTQKNAQTELRTRWLRYIMAKRDRRNPELNLVPEEQKVLSQDFNLFYVPQEAPLPAGMKEFTASLENFVNGGATKAVLGAEVKMKKSERAKALKDYNEMKGKFRDAVKNGEIDKTANPYYLQKYKELTLNSFANQFTERALEAYNNSGVKKDLSEGAFEKFYKENLLKFVKEKELGFFTPEELEKSFFQQTSQYRQQLEATHKQNLLNEFNADFDNKIKDRIVGTIETYKNFDTELLSEAEIQSGVTKWDKISETLQKEITDLFEVTGNGRDVIDTIFEGLELYITSTDDYEFALQVIQEIPQLLEGGTGSIADIGRLANRQQELRDLLIAKQNEKLNEEVKFEANKDKMTTN